MQIPGLQAVKLVVWPAYQMHTNSCRLSSICGRGQTTVLGCLAWKHSKRCHHCEMIWYHMPCGEVEPCTHAGDTLCIILRIPKKFGLDFKHGCSCCRFSKAALKQLRTICLRNPCAVVAHEAQLRLDANLWALQDSYFSQFYSFP